MRINNFKEAVMPMINTKISGSIYSAYKSVALRNDLKMTDAHEASVVCFLKNIAALTKEEAISLGVENKIIKIVYQNNE